MTDQPSNSIRDWADLAENGIIAFDEDANVIVWNQWMACRSGIDAERVLGQCLADAMRLDEAAVIVDCVKQAIDKRYSRILSHSLHRYPIPLYRPDAVGDDDARIAQRVVIKPYVPAVGKAGALVQVFDLSASVEREAILRSKTGEITQKEEFLRTLVESTRDGVVAIDARGTITLINSAACEIFGYGDESELLGRSINIFMPEPDCSVHDYYLENYHQRGGGVSQVVSGGREVVAKHKDGTQFPLWLSVGEMTIRGEKQFISTLRDITEQKNTERQIKHLALHDALTGLPNRIQFQEHLDYALQRASRDDHLGAVMFLDLNRFKAVNDSLGHHVGDELLQAVANRLRDSLRDADSVARLGGDEFAVIQTNLTNIQGAETLAEKIVAALSAPYDINGEEIHTGVSIGIAVFPFEDVGINQLLMQADLAMYKAKGSGASSYRFYQAEMQKNIDGRRLLEADLRRALGEEQLELHYQPQIDIDTHMVSGVEALVRWRHPARGMISPGDFIPVAEETGLITSIGEWVVNEACRQLRKWQDAGLPAFKVAVNLSAEQFGTYDLVKTVSEALKRHAVAPACLELEITESTLMSNATSAIEQLQGLHGLGVELSIDDFGTGYSSLAYLKRFSVHTLKIDRSFINDIGEDKDDEAIVGAVISMGHSLSLKIVGEGVETEKQLSYLANLGCDLVQGFYFSKPLPAEQLAAFVAATTDRDAVSKLPVQAAPGR